MPRQYTLLTSARYRAEHPGEFDRIVRARLAFSPSLSSYLRQAGAGANFDASGRVRDIDAPTLVIHGSDDRLVAVANASSAPSTSTGCVGAGRTGLWVVAIRWLTIIFDGYDLIDYGAVVPSLLEYRDWSLAATSSAR